MFSHILSVALSAVLGFMGGASVADDTPPKTCENWGCTWHIGGSDSLGSGCFPTFDTTDAEDGDCKCKPTAGDPENLTCQKDSDCNAVVSFIFHAEQGVGSMCVDGDPGTPSACWNWPMGTNTVTWKLKVESCGGQQGAWYYLRTDQCPYNNCGGAGTGAVTICRSRRTLECRTCDCPQCLCPGDPEYPEDN